MQQIDDGLMDQFGDRQLHCLTVFAKRDTKREAAMNCIKTTLRILLTTIAALQLAACSRTVQWKEEVLLNTGETIWISKVVRYTINGQPGNPLDMGYLPDHAEVTSFEFDGREYVFNEPVNTLVLAISNHKTPVFLAEPASKGWYKLVDFPMCATPYYVQFVPDSTGLRWTWLEHIEPWTYNLHTNLMLDRYSPSRLKDRYTMADKAKQHYWMDRHSVDIQKIDPSKMNQNCQRH